MTGVAALMLSRADLAFLLYDWLDVEALAGCDRDAQHSRATFDAALELSERVAGDHFAPSELPRTGPLLDMMEHLDRSALDMRESWFSVRMWQRRNPSPSC
jgi:hypothetical protein